MKSLVLGLALLTASASATAETVWPICSGGHRAARMVSCVVDGDTFWLKGVKMRMAGIDAPELRARCGHEKRLAIAARYAVRVALAQPGAMVHRTGRKGRYGRDLVRVSISGADLGAALIAGGLAVPYRRGVKADWCAKPKGGTP